MTVGLTGNVDGGFVYKKQNIDGGVVYKKPFNTGKISTPYNKEIDTNKEKNDDSFLSNKCTDGKNDGNIGIGNAIGHVAKGAVNTVVDVAKGCVTDSEGNFSVGKTALTAATIGACVAFPALGLGLAALGVGFGAINAGKGIYNAATATNDEDAKKAWQQVGGGGVVAGASLVGAKSSLGALKSASTAGTNGASALESLGSNASLAEKATALGKDVVSSTKNQAKPLTDLYNIRNSRADLAKSAEKLKANEITKQEYSDAVKAHQILYTNANKKAQTLDVKIDGAVNSVKNGLGSIKNALKHPIDTIVNGFNSAKTVAGNSIDVAKNGISNGYTAVKNIKLQDVKDGVSNKVKETADTLKEKVTSDEFKIAAGTTTTSETV